MKATLFPLWLLLAAVGASCCFAAPASIVLDSSSHITITNSGPASGELELAREFLTRYLLAALGKSELTGDGAALAITLHADALTWRDLPAGKLSDLRDLDAFTITVSDSPQPAVRIEAGSVMATTFGVIQWLEDDLQVTWLFPGELGLALSESQRFTLQPGTRRFRPSVVSRFYTGMKYGDPAQMPSFRQRFGKGPLYYQRHFFEAYDYFKSLRLHGLAMPSHNMINIYPPEKMQAEHPEVMPMLPGGQRYQPPAKNDAKPNEHQHWHPCYTNPTSRRIAIDAARAAFARGELCFSLGINDGLRQQCQCETCRSVGWPASYYQYVTAVAEALRDTYPPHLVGVLVYGDVRQAADDLRLPDNVFALVSAGSKLEPWSRRAAHLGRYEYFYGKGFGIPSFPLAAMKHNAKVYERFGVQSLRAEVHPIWAFDAPKVYVHARLLWNSAADADALLARWCRAAFGKGGPAVERLFRHWAAKSDYLVPTGSTEPAPLVDMARWRSSAAQFESADPEDYRLTFACLDEAAALVSTQAQKDRLAMLRTRFELSRAEFEIYHGVQQLYAGQGGTAPAQTVQTLATLAQQREQAEKTIEAHPQWQVAGGDIERRAGWSLDQEMKSGLITAIVQMRRAGKLSPAALAGIPQPYAVCANPTTPLPGRKVKVLDKGTYWALETSKHRFKPMVVDLAEQGFTAASDGVNDLVTEGSTAGQYREHWAMVLVPMHTTGKRVLYEVTLRATAKSGVLAMDLTNPWRVAAGDGLPVGTAAEFDAAGRTLERKLIVEPVDPTSAQFNQPFQFRLSLLWTPGGDDARCQSQVTISAMELADQP